MQEVSPLAVNYWTSSDGELVTAVEHSLPTTIQILGDVVEAYNHEKVGGTQKTMVFMK